MDKRKMFQRRHYEIMASGMAQMAQALENIEAQRMMSLPESDRRCIKAEMYSAVVETLSNVFTADNPAFSKKMFCREFQTYLHNELHKIHLDKVSTMRYTIAVRY